MGERHQDLQKPLDCGLVLRVLLEAVADQLEHRAGDEQLACLR